ncbi:2og-fe oxygenase family protein [Fonsecaea pedrosoi]|nr:2og-fe oxygenase family protein [Fonsecaea pedrosoi]
MPSKRKRPAKAAAVVPKTPPTESIVPSAADTADPSTADLSNALANFMKSGSNIAATCGGSIPLSDFAALVSRVEGKPSSQADDTEKGPKKKGKRGSMSTPTTTRTTRMDPSPIVIDWEDHGGWSNRVMFPIPPDSEIDSTMTIEGFLEHCEPIVLGKPGDDGYGEGADDAWTLNALRVTTNLCPYSMGIVDRAEHLLLPNARHMGPNGIKNGGFVRAELHQINVYVGHPGSSKIRFEIPGAENQFGSLVLFLPSEYEGGQLTVNHAGSSTKYDCDGARKSQALHWAAFLSDCEHEISEVTGGYCVIVTYNLYHDRRIPFIPGGEKDPLQGLGLKPAPMDFTSLAPYNILQDLLRDPKWMPDGGMLGIHCAHAYPIGVSNLADSGKAQNQLISDWPAGFAMASLRGTDASMHAVLGKLGLHAEVGLKGPAEGLSPDIEWVNGPIVKHWVPPKGVEDLAKLPSLAENSMCIFVTIPPARERDTKPPAVKPKPKLAIKKPKLRAKD